MLLKQVAVNLVSKRYLCISVFLTSLLTVLSEHMNAEVAAGTISSKQDAMDYITWTYFFRRLVMNPRLGSPAHTMCYLQQPSMLIKARAHTHTHAYIPNLHLQPG